LVFLLPVFINGLLVTCKVLWRLPAVFLRRIIQPRHQILYTVPFGGAMLLDMIHLVLRSFSGAALDRRRRRHIASGEMSRSRMVMLQIFEVD
jgi:hypothetical protein